MTIKRAIDAHVHVWTSDNANYPLETGFSDSELLRPGFTSDEFLAIARPLGVERAVLVQMDCYGLDNSYLLDTIQRFPGVFSGVAQVDEHMTELRAEFQRLMLGGIRGIRIVPPGNGSRTWLDSSGMRDLWQCSARQPMVVCPLIDASQIPAISRMCQLHPETPVVIDHMANIGSDGTFREADLQSLCNLAHTANTYVKVSAFYYLGQKCPPYAEISPVIRRLLDAFGAERLMWGSDSPFQLEPPNSYQASIEFVNERLDFLSNEEKAWLMAGTSEKVFFS